MELGAPNRAAMRNLPLKDAAFRETNMMLKPSPHSAGLGKSDRPLRLDVAPAIAFQDRSMTGSGVQRRKGRV